jgi:hypothetical protein
LAVEREITCALTDYVVIPGHFSMMRSGSYDGIIKNALGLLENGGVMVLHFHYTGNRKIPLSALAIWEKPVFYES